VIYDEEWVIALASCFNVKDLDKYHVFAGETFLFEDEGTEQEKQVLEIIKHPGFE
jgi:Trypsin